MADFFGYEHLLKLSLVYPDGFKQFTAINNMMKNFEAIPQIKAFFDSGKSKKAFYPPFLAWS